MSFGRRFSFSDDSHFFFSFARVDEEETSVLYFLFFFRFHSAPFFSFSLRELRPRREAPRLSQGASPVSRERLKRKEQKEEEEDSESFVFFLLLPAAAAAAFFFAPVSLFFPALSSVPRSSRDVLFSFRGGERAEQDEKWSTRGSRSVEKKQAKREQSVLFCLSSFLPLVVALSPISHVQTTHRDALYALGHWVEAERARKWRKERFSFSIFFRRASSSSKARRDERRSDEATTTKKQKKLNLVSFFFFFF